jgi:hypothetical protein
MLPTSSHLAMYIDVVGGFVIAKCSRTIVELVYVLVDTYHIVVVVVMMFVVVRKGLLVW